MGLVFLGDHAEYVAGLGYGERHALVEEINRLAVRPELTYRHR